MTSYLKAVRDADLPDDPRECCRQILDALKAVDEYAISKAPAALARMTQGMLESAVDMDDCRDGLIILARQAAEAAELYEEAVNRAWTLARHGTTEHRAMDAISEARQRIMEAGEQPPDWLHWLASDMVNWRMRQAAEAGESLSEAEAVERLVAEGPPPRSPAQERLSELIRIINEMDKEQEERLLAAARELVA